MLRTTVSQVEHGPKDVEVDYYTMVRNHGIYKSVTGWMKDKKSRFISRQQGVLLYDAFVGTVYPTSGCWTDHKFVMVNENITISFLGSKS